MGVSTVYNPKNTKHKKAYIHKKRVPYALVNNLYINREIEMLIFYIRGGYFAVRVCRRPGRRRHKQSGAQRVVPRRRGRAAGPVREPVGAAGGGHHCQGGPTSRRDCTARQAAAAGCLGPARRAGMPGRLGRSECVRGTRDGATAAP